MTCLNKIQVSWNHISKKFKSYALRLCSLEKRIIYCKLTQENLMYNVYWFVCFLIGYNAHHGGARICLYSQKFIPLPVKANLKLIFIIHSHLLIICEQNPAKKSTCSLILIQSSYLQLHMFRHLACEIQLIQIWQDPRNRLRLSFWSA